MGTDPNIAEAVAAAIGRHPKFPVLPGMLLGAAGRVWRVTHRDSPAPLPGEWLPVLSDAATAGVLLDLLAREVESVKAARYRDEDGEVRWRVVGYRGTLRSAVHEDLGVAVALVLIAPWDAL